LSLDKDARTKNLKYGHRTVVHKTEAGHGSGVRFAWQKVKPHPGILFFLAVQEMPKVFAQVI
jgi:hypothetical protein